jgi:RecA/RadA recombinase
LRRLFLLSQMFPPLAVVVTNQTYKPLNTFFGDPIQALGEQTIAHCSTTRLYLRKGKDEQRIVRVMKSPLLAEAEAIFAIYESGITDVISC